MRGPGAQEADSLPGGLHLEGGQSGTLTIGRTTDEQGRTHDLVLHAPEVADALRGGSFVVLTGSRFSVTGDAVVGDWRFTVDLGATGATAPIVVLKSTDGAVSALAKVPAKFSYPSQLSGDLGATSARLRELVGTALARAQDDPLYRPLARILTDPNWNGVLIFDATVPAVPGTVRGRTTGPAAGARVPAFGVAFAAPAMSRVADTAGGAPTQQALSAVVDASPPAADGSASGRLRAGFTNSALSYFQLGD